MVVVSVRGRARARSPSARVQYNVLPIALALVFPVVGLEQILHTSTTEFVSQPVYEALHWLSDSLMALPFCVAAIWAGQWLANRLDVGSRAPSDILTRACMIALLLAVLLVPGEALHDQADRLTHTRTHAALGFHSHAPASTSAPDGISAIGAQALHGLTDGLEGQAVGLPLAFVALMWVRRKEVRV